MPTEPINISERIVLNYYTAKRLLAALHMSVQRHEAAFGVLETDMQKRVRPAEWAGPKNPPRFDRVVAVSLTGAECPPAR